MAKLLVLSVFVYPTSAFHHLTPEFAAPAAVKSVGRTSEQLYKGAPKSFVL